MLSKEEIKKQDREHIKKVLAENKNYIFEFDTDNIKTDDILEYINQLETKLEKAYWEGFIAKQNEAMEICKQCKYIKKVKQLEAKLDELCKGQQSLMQSRRKWKKRYYKMRNKNKDLQKSVEQIYDDYQDIGKIAFDYSDKIDQLESDKQKLIEKLENKIRYFEENDELIATSNDNYSDGTVIKRFIDEFKEILEILK